jgi:hypothetical protein
VAVLRRIHPPSRESLDRLDPVPHGVPVHVRSRGCSGTMAAIVLGGASTIGGVGLGYEYGISGMWLVFAIGVGILLLSLLSRAEFSGWASTPSVRCSNYVMAPALPYSPAS